MAKQNLQDFLIALSKDVALRARFKKDPDAVMQEAGLTAEESALVKSGDTAAMREYLGDSTAAMMVEVDE